MMGEMSSYTSLIFFLIIFAVCLLPFLRKTQVFFLFCGVLACVISLSHNEFKNAANAKETLVSEGAVLSKSAEEVSFAPDLDFKDIVVAPPLPDRVVKEARAAAKIVVDTYDGLDCRSWQEHLREMRPKYSVAGWDALEKALRPFLEEILEKHLSVIAKLADEPQVVKYSDTKVFVAFPIATNLSFVDIWVYVEAESVEGKTVVTGMTVGKKI